METYARPLAKEVANHQPRPLEDLPAPAVRIRSGARTSGFPLAKPVVRLANFLLRPSGFQVAPAAPLDFRGVVADPIEGTYHAPRRPFLLDVALENCRSLGLLAFACTAEAKHPFVETLLAYARGECHTYADSPLKSYYETWQPTNAADALGLNPRHAHPLLRRAPALGAVRPWSNSDPQKALTSKIESLESENRRHGIDLSHEHGQKQWGPVSAMKGELEFKRLKYVYNSIRRKGYRPADYRGGNIEARHVLCSNGASRILIFSGQHRVAALVALGHDHAPIQLQPLVIQRDDVLRWPNVRAGIFSQEQALAFFDRTFNGSQPAGYHWPSIQAGS